MLDFYLSIIQEKLEDLKIPKKKWYDIINMKLKKLYQKEIKRMFENNFKFNHPMIDSRKTKITVTAPLVGYNFWVIIHFYDKAGKDIIDYKHPSNTLNEPYTIQLLREKNGKWTPYYHTLFLKKQYQGKKIGSGIIKATNEVVRKLQNTKFAYYQSTNIGRYAFSRVPGVKFKDERGTCCSHDKVKSRYLEWCRSKNLSCRPGRKPSDYPKEFLLSRKAPEFIDYLVPI